MIIAEVTIVPLGTATPSVSRYVAACHRVLEKAPGVRHQLTPMSTVLEGEWAAVMGAIAQMHEVPFQEGAQRVSTTIRIDDRRDKEITMEGKVRAVEDKLR